jgi:hypothetical protein
VSSKRSKIHPKYKTKYRVKNWAAYDRALVGRGDFTLWITPEALEAWRPAHTGSCGAQPKFSNVAIETALTLRSAPRHDVLHIPFEFSTPRVVDLPAARRDEYAYQDVPDVVKESTASEPCMGQRRPPLVEFPPSFAHITTGTKA